ncbi:endonuclease/exonuclease/phosphatase family protein [Streptomyces sp. NPDC090075]|uniref:endonuclease/exonuclease/phosphatase family protein n=1 Tax=unclassified Streptomyces TaxID=2593676 RepID=UPI003806EA7B
MTLRIATFNAENLFRRATVFDLADAALRKQVLDEFAELVSLLDHPAYSDGDKHRIAELIEKYKAYDLDPENPPPIYINQTRGGTAQLFRKSGPDADPVITVTAKGRPHWAGWAELVQDDVDLDVVKNTGRVVTEINADVLLMVEVEDRLSLDRFNTQILGGLLHKRPYPFNLLIDGNDSRGIDVGILSRLPIRSVRSHIADKDAHGQPVFSRDCPEYEIDLDGSPLWILGNHFKSKRGGGLARRKAQAERVTEIYEAALERSPHVLVAGDLNDSPDSEPVRLLLDTGLRDVMSHPGYAGDPGTYGTGHTLSQKIDYLLLSPELWGLVRHVDVERRGVWAPRTFKSFDTVTSKANEASDHGALFADLDL